MKHTGPTPQELARVRWLVGDAVRVIRNGGKALRADALYRLDEAATIIQHGDGWRGPVRPLHYADFPP